MDLRKLKTLIDLVQASGIAEIEINEEGDHVRIVNRPAQAAQAAWSVACGHLRNPEIGLVVLDEMTYAFKYGWLDLASVIAELNSRPPMQHVIITGRGAPDALRDAADTVSDIGNEKHAFKAGVKAMPGLDW